MSEDNFGKKYSYEDLLEIMRTLRSEHGCPWDREQTHESLMPCMTEEAAEVLAAIRIYKRTDRDDNLIEELGDLLLQVIMHAQIANEEERFSMEDVVHGIASKMIRRHPHVFGEAEAKNASQVLEDWEEIKKREKEYLGQESPLREIPKELPSLVRAVKILAKEDKLYQKQPEYKEVLERLKEAVQSLSQTLPEDNFPEILSKSGDILMALSQIARIYKFSLEQILSDRIEEVIIRYEE